MAVVMYPHLTYNMIIQSRYT